MATNPRKRARKSRGTAEQDAAPAALPGGQELPYGLSEADLAPSVLESIQGSSVPADVALGGRKRTRNKFQEHLQEAEAKRLQQEQEEQAGMSRLISAIRSEDGPSGPFVAQTFVRGGTEGAPTQQQQRRAAPAAEVYMPQPLYAAAPPQPSRAPESTGKRAIDELRDTFASSRRAQKEQDRVFTRPSRSANVYLAGLHHAACEGRIFDLFSKCGPISSIKILRKPHNQCSVAFVSFMRAEDADSAIAELNGVRICGKTTVVTPARPARSFPGRPLKFVPYNDNDPIAEKMAMNVHRSEIPEYLRSNVFVNIPSRVDWERDISALARKAAATEEPLASFVERHAADPRYGWLRDRDSNRNRFFLWKVHSLRNRESEKRWSMMPFRMEAGGPYWVPPDVLSDSQERERAEKAEQKLRQQQQQRTRQQQQQQREQQLQQRLRPPPPRDMQRAAERARGAPAAGELSAPATAEVVQRRPEVHVPLPLDKVNAFAELLADVTTSKHDVLMAMGFAMEHADYAVDVCERVREAAVREGDGAVLSKRLALLYLVSDILSNISVVKKGSDFQRGFQARLPDMFEALSRSFQASSGRITKLSVKKKVLRVLSAWESWSVFPAPFLGGLQATFLLDENNAVVGKDLDQAASMAGGVAAVDMEQAERMSVSELARLCEENGLSTSGDREALLARLAKLQQLAKLKEERSHNRFTRTELEAEFATFETMLAEITGSRTAAREAAGKEAPAPAVEEHTAGKEGDGVEQQQEELDFIPFDDDEEEEDGEDGTQEAATSKQQRRVEEVSPVDLASEFFARLDEEIAMQPESAAALPLPAGGGGVAEEDIDGVPMDIDGQPLEDIDGQPLEDIDGQPLEDIDGQPMEIDGQPMDIDGQPLDDIDGLPLDGGPLAPADDIDGEAIDIDGEPIDIDGVPIDIDGVPVTAAASAAHDHDLDGVPLDGVPLAGVPLAGVPLDGVPIDGVPLDGVPLDGGPGGVPLDYIDGAPLEDIDGAPLEEIDGVPLDGVPLAADAYDDDVDGVPL